LISGWKVEAKKIELQKEEEAEKERKEEKDEEN
jgi:hypothetical protein